jgi:hypothetical protein
MALVSRCYGYPQQYISPKYYERDQMTTWNAVATGHNTASYDNMLFLAIFFTGSLRLLHLGKLRLHTGKVFV